MFVPKIARPRAKAAESSTSRPVRQSSTVANRPPGEPADPDTEAASLADRGGEAGLSWDFGAIPILAPDRAAGPSTGVAPFSGAPYPRLAVGRVDDPLEREADRVADQGMRGPISGPPEARSPGASTIEAPGIVHEVLRSPGQPLDPASRAEFETRLGQDLGGVRVHHDGHAGASTRAIHARAYAVGGDIVFGDGRYAPETPSGRHLLAHELAHVIQQRQAVAPANVVRRLPDGLPDKVPDGFTTGFEVVSALTAFLQKVQAAEGTQDLHVTTSVRQALGMLAAGDFDAGLRIEGFLGKPEDLPGSPDEFARRAVDKLPVLIARTRLDQLNQIPAKASQNTQPTSAGDALGSLFDTTVKPLIGLLPIPADAQAKLLSSFHDAVAAGVVGLLDAALSDSRVDAKSAQALHAAFAEALRRKTTDPPTGGAGASTDSPFIQQPPPSVVPPLDPSPGETIIPSPPIPAPTPDGTKPPAPQGPTPAQGATLDQVIRGIDVNALLPPEFRGKPEADVLIADARAFARDLGGQLDDAQKAKRFSVELTLSAAYRATQDLPGFLDQVASIVHSVADALPHHASRVGQVVVQVAADRQPGDKPDGPAPPTFVRRIVRLHESP